LKFIKLKEFKADILLLSVAISWGVTFLMVQDAIKIVPVYAFLFYRFAIAAILMFLISYNRFGNINKQNMFYGVILGIILFLGFATQTFALIYTKSSIVAFLTGIYIVTVPFLSYLLFKDKIRKNVLIATIITMIGLYLLTLSGTLQFGFGEFLSVICAFMFALHIVLTGKFSTKSDVFLIVSFQLLTVALLSMLFSLAYEPVTFNVGFNTVFIKALVITSIIATVYAFLIQTYFQQFTTPTKTAIIFAMEPVSASFYGYFIGGEILTLVQISGAVLIVISMLLAEIKLKGTSNKSKVNG